MSGHRESYVPAGNTHDVHRYIAFGCICVIVGSIALAAFLVGYWMGTHA